jgi:hypothetical protein
MWYHNVLVVELVGGDILIVTVLILLAPLAIAEVVIDTPT